jgi:response regulator RpfG family c-di-GMP phosphodiesterase
MSDSKHQILYFGQEGYVTQRLSHALDRIKINLYTTHDLSTAKNQSKSKNHYVVFIAEGPEVNDLTTITAEMRACNPNAQIIIIASLTNDIYTNCLLKGADHFIQLPAPERIFLKYIETTFKRVKELAAMHKIKKEDHLVKAQVAAGISPDEYEHIQLSMLSLFNPKLAEHAERVGDLVKKFCSFLKFPKEVSEYLVLAANLHDIGMLNVPPELVHKDTRSLTEEETEALDKHVIYGESVVSHMNTVSVQKMIRHHHENFDGTGYPDGVSGEDIPLGARILAVVDAWDELQYGQIKSESEHQQAHEYLLKYAGSKYDPKIVQAFIKLMKTQPKESKRQRRLSSDQLKAGMIVARDIVDDKGDILVKSGQSIDPATLKLLISKQETEGVQDDVVIYKPKTVAFTQLSAEDIKKLKS